MPRTGSGLGCWCQCGSRSPLPAFSRTLAAEEAEDRERLRWEIERLFSMLDRRDMSLPAILQMEAIETLLGLRGRG